MWPLRSWWTVLLVMKWNMREGKTQFSPMISLWAKVLGLQSRHKSTHIITLQIAWVQGMENCFEVITVTKLVIQLLKYFHQQKSIALGSGKKKNSEVYPYEQSTFLLIWVNLKKKISPLPRAVVDFPWWKYLKSYDLYYHWFRSNDPCLESCYLQSNKLSVFMWRFCRPRTFAHDDLQAKWPLRS